MCFLCWQLHFYSLVKASHSPLADCIPSLLDGGLVVYHKKAGGGRPGFLAQTWDGSGDVSSALVGRHGETGQKGNGEGQGKEAAAKGGAEGAGSRGSKRSTFKGMRMKKKKAKAAPSPSAHEPISGAQEDSACTDAMSLDSATPATQGLPEADTNGSGSAPRADVPEAEANGTGSAGRVGVPEADTNGSAGREATGGGPWEGPRGKGSGEEGLREGEKRMAAHWPYIVTARQKGWSMDSV